MKLLTVVLALALFTGSWASVVRDKRETSYEELKNRFHEYTRNITRDFHDQLAMVKKSDLYQGVEDQSFQVYENLSQRFQEVDAVVPKEVKEAAKELGDIAKVVVEKVSHALAEHMKRMMPAKEKLADAVLQAASPYTDPLMGHVSTYADALQASVQEMRRNQHERLRQHLEQLEAQLSPRVKSVRSWWEGFRVTLQPLVDDVVQHLRQDAQKASEALKPYLAPIVERAREYSAEFKKRADDTKGHH